MESKKQALAHAAGGVFLRAAKGLSFAATSLLAATLPAHASPGDTQLVSRPPDGGEATSGWLDTGKSISADGRFVVFVSWSSTLVDDDTNNAGDVFVKDRETGEVERVNVSSSEVQGNHTSWRPVINANGRYVVFETNSTNVVAHNPDSNFVLALRDRKLGRTELISVDRTGSHARPASDASISADGRYVAFASAASDLVDNDTNGVQDIFVRDRQERRTERVSVASNGRQANCHQWGASISASGRYVAFNSCADVFAAHDRNGGYDAFVHDRHEHVTRRVSFAMPGGHDAGGVIGSTISANGRYVAFATDAALLPEDTNSRFDVFVHDRATGQTELASMDEQEGAADGDSLGAALSADGHYVAFWSSSHNLTPEPFGPGIFVRDRWSGTLERASVDSHGGPTRYVGLEPAISADGRFVAFDTDTPLVPADTNRDHPSYDVYVHEVGATRTPAFAYTIYPAELDFGERELGTKASLSFWLRNQGPSSLPIQRIHLAGRDKQEFSRWHRCEFLFPGESCRIRITLHASSTGPKSAAVWFVAGIGAVRTRPVSATVVPASD